MDTVGRRRREVILSFSFSLVLVLRAVNDVFVSSTAIRRSRVYSQRSLRRLEQEAVPDEAPRLQQHPRKITATSHYSSLSTCYMHYLC